MLIAKAFDNIHENASRKVEVKRCAREIH